MEKSAFAVEFKNSAYNVLMNNILPYGCEIFFKPKQILSEIGGFTTRCFVRMINIQFSSLSRTNVIDMREKSPLILAGIVYEIPINT
jgi:hypothetical protein